MKKNILLSLLVCSSLSTTLFAEQFFDTRTPSEFHSVPIVFSYPYIGGAFALTKVEDDFVNFIFPRDSERTNIDYNSVMFQAGYQFNLFLAAEFRYWSSISDGDYTTNSRHNTATSYESFDAWGMYLKPMYPLSPVFSIYGLLGFSSVSVDGVSPGSEILFDDADFSWGAGILFDVTPHISIFVDYVSLFDDRLDSVDTLQDTKVDTLNVGVTYKF